ncbi:hypothetical protein MJN76_34785, partial [Salmonella enterica subsp. enterica serovar Anatum]|nr:hypothetical protein [Salmonella enterica subsp. enterica serovar Anatum]
MVNSSVLVLCFITLPPKLTFSKYVQKGKYQCALDLTTRKLESLTDIERQLSTRKPSGNYNADTPHTNDKPATSE